MTGIKSNFKVKDLQKDLSVNYHRIKKVLCFPSTEEIEVPYAVMEALVSVGTWISTTLDPTILALVDEEESHETTLETIMLGDMKEKSIV